MAMAGALDTLGQALLGDTLTVQLLRKAVYHCDVHGRLATKQGLKRKAGVASPRRASLADESDRLTLVDMEAGDASGVRDVTAAAPPKPCGIVAPGSPGSPRPLCSLDPDASAAHLALLLASGASLLHAAANAELLSGAHITFEHDGLPKFQTLLAALRLGGKIVGGDVDTLLPVQGALAELRATLSCPAMCALPMMPGTITQRRSAVYMSSHSCRFASARERPSSLASFPCNAQ